MTLENFMRSEFMAQLRQEYPGEHSSQHFYDSSANPALWSMSQFTIVHQRREHTSLNLLAAQKLFREHDALF